MDAFDVTEETVCVCGHKIRDGHQLYGDEYDAYYGRCLDSECDCVDPEAKGEA